MLKANHISNTSVGRQTKQTITNHTKTCTSMNNQDVLKLFQIFKKEKKMILLICRRKFNSPKLTRLTKVN